MQISEQLTSRQILMILSGIIKSAQDSDMEVLCTDVQLMELIRERYAQLLSFWESEGQP